MSYLAGGHSSWPYLTDFSWLQNRHLKVVAVRSEHPSEVNGRCQGRPQTRRDDEQSLSAGAFGAGFEDDFRFPILGYQSRRRYIRRVDYSCSSERRV